MKLIIIVFLFIMVFCDCNTTDSIKDKITKIIENGRKLNCSKFSTSKQLKFEFPQNKSGDAAVNYKNVTHKPNLENVKFLKNESAHTNIVHRGHNKINHPPVAMDHVELHFNITNVFEENSSNGAYSAQHYIEYEGLEVKNNSTNSHRTLVHKSGGSTKSILSTEKTIIKDKIIKAKSINAPVYLILS